VSQSPAPFRPFPLDGALLLFDRSTGTHVLLDGPETAALRQGAPRVVQFGLTNLCNLACAFCSRDTRAESRWTPDDAFRLLADLAAAGVLEVAFGGGEPLAFRGFEELVARLHAETPLAIHATTNGVLLTSARVAALRGRIGQIRVSLYDDNDWRRSVALLASADVRFGVNLLVLPERLDRLEAWVLQLMALGCRDVLLLSYNGENRSLHLSPAQSADLARRVGVLHRALPALRLGLDVCWGERMAPVPRFGVQAGCGAGRDFVVITSDKRLLPCSFHDRSFAIEDAADVLAIWREQAAALASPARLPGCARVAGYGLTEGA
jgi:MoaA/NifB/PqqE/SkfB family radical SAM enzyme